MRRGSVLVEQVLPDGTIIDDYDTSLSTSEITDILCKFFPNVRLGGSSPTFYVGEYKDCKYAIRCKNVTYLGNPHPIYKKRIQIADDLYTFYRTAKEINAKPILLGIYSYDGNVVFVDFKIDTYIEKKAHNSSAHVYTSDLSAAITEGYFQKIDYFGNTVTAFRPDVVDVFLDEFFEVYDDGASYWGDSWKQEPMFESEHVIGDNETVYRITREKPRSQVYRSLSYTQVFKEKIMPEIQKFFDDIDKKWHGIDCYKKMISSNYKNKYQSEWAGYFLEFCFEQYLKKNKLEGLITYHQDKKDGGVDLDLLFPIIQCYGDLKAHSKHSRAIQGNDWDTIFSILNKKDETSHIFYIICEHETEKDNEYDYEVTKFWNSSKNKQDLLSYHTRMKNNVTLERVYILDINYQNKAYLTMFKQGINSNGKPRAPKIMIENDNLKHFIIEEIIL